MKSASGPRGTGSQTKPLADPPVRHHGPGAADADAEGARNTHRTSRFTSPPRRREGFERGSPKRAMLAQVCRPLRRKVLRSAGQRHRLATVAWVLHDSRGNTFRFVVCRNSIQGAMALQLRVSNHRWQPHDGFFDRKVGGLGGRWRKQS